MIVDVVYFYSIFRWDAIHSITYPYRQHASDVHWKTKSHRPRNMEWVSRKRRGVQSRIAATFLQQYNNRRPKRISYDDQCTKWTKSQTSIEFFFWVISLDGTIYLKLQLKNVDGVRPLQYSFCFLLYFYLIANKSAIVFIVFVWWNHGTYFSQFSFISLTNVMMGRSMQCIDIKFLYKCFTTIFLFSVFISSANVLYLSILCLIIFLLSLRLWYIQCDRKRHRSRLPVTNRQEKKINFMESI